MKKLLVLFSVLILALVLTASANAAEVALTSIGQSSDAMMVRVLMKSLGISSDYDAVMKPDALTGQKVLIAVVGIYFSFGLEFALSICAVSVICISLQTDAGSGDAGRSIAGLDDSKYGYFGHRLHSDIHDLGFIFFQFESIILADVAVGAEAQAVFAGEYIRYEEFAQRVCACGGIAAESDVHSFQRNAVFAQYCTLDVAYSAGDHHKGGLGELARESSIGWIGGIIFSAVAVYIAATISSYCLGFEVFS